MANNRMALFCPACKELVVLMKHYGSGWHYPMRSEQEDLVSDFGEDHFNCVEGSDGTHIELRYEWVPVGHSAVEY